MKKTTKERMSEKDECIILLRLFAIELIKRHKAMGMIQKEFVFRSGISQSKLSDFENGKGNPTFKTIHHIVRSLDTTFTIMFRDKGFNKKY